MYINIDLQAEEPIYTQLKHQIIEGIAKGEVALGEGLPSVRSLAADLGINLHTVNKAYQQLKQEGFILIHRQKGVVINPEGFPLIKEHREKLTHSLRPLVAESICRGMEEAEFFRLCSQLYQEFSQKKEEN